MLSTSPDGSADKIQVFDFKMNYKLLSPSTISLYTPTFLSTMLQIVIEICQPCFHPLVTYTWRDLNIKQVLPQLL